MWYMPIFILCLTSCSTYEGQVTEVMKCVEVLDSSYEYPEQSKLVVAGKQYFVRQKAIYGVGGKLEKLILYKAEGRIEYNLKDLMNDEAILEYAGISIEQQLRFNGAYLVDGDREMKVNKISNDLLQAEKQGEVTLYRIK